MFWSSKYWRLLLLSFGFLSEVFGQSPDSVRRLEEVVIASTRIRNHSVGYRVQRVDSFALANSSSSNLTELLTRNSNVHVRSYGVNGLSAPNLRGSGNSHTAILWNGINLQSPASGELDISLLPATFIDDVSVQFGGAASLFGAGSIGGAIHLENKPVFDRGISLSLAQNYGSFNRHHQSYSVGWSNDKFSSSVKLFSYSAENDFQFRNTTKSGAPKEKRAHSGANQKGLLLQNYWKWNPQNQLSLRFWIQDNNIKVPEPITVPLDDQSLQEDDFNRTLLTWEHLGKNHTSTFKSALINHNTAFSDTISTSNFPATTYHSLINEFEVNKDIVSGITLNLGVNTTYEWVNSDNHQPDTPTRNRTSAFFSAKKTIGKKTILNIRAREEIVAGELTPFIPSFGVEYYLNNQLRLKSSISRNYLFPTFNQLYWSGAGGFGNLTLKPELSWSEELGIIFDRQSKNGDWEFNTEATLFSSQVENWILWVPVNPSEWSPNNIKRVWSRGLESSAKITRKWSDVSVEIQSNYSFTKATNEGISTDGNPSEIDKQLIYTPQHSGKLNATISFKTMKLGWWHHITGKQFTDGSNTEIQSLYRFGVSSIVLSRRFKIASLDTGFQFEVNNIFNNNYLVRAGYPMPLRNIRFGLTINL